jgi:hypothetical protein
VTTSFRLHRTFRDRLKAAARAERRSMTAQLEHLITEALDARDRKARRA